MTLIELLIVIAIIGIILVMIFNSRGCSQLSEPQAVQALKDAGFQDVTITDVSRWNVAYKGCGRDDTIRYEATVTNSQGQRVRCAVCSGYYKDATIRMITGE